MWITCNIYTPQVTKCSVPDMSVDHIALKILLILGPSLRPWARYVRGNIEDNIFTRVIAAFDLRASIWRPYLALWIN